jgi:formamidopyrimidine-DNA glycosylase
VATLDEERRRELYRAMRAVLEWARPILEAEVAEGLYQSNEEWRDHLRVHRKAEQPCPRCGTPIRAQVQSSRETNYCLTCQPLAL